MGHGTENQQFLAARRNRPCVENASEYAVEACAVGDVADAVKHENALVDIADEL
ncbi:hypothetical protein ACMS1Z_09575 [Acidiphilium multivorum]